VERFGRYFSLAREFLACFFHFEKKSLRVSERIADQVVSFLTAEHIEHSFARFRIPEAVQRVTHPRARDAEPDVLRSDLLNGMCFIENDEIVLEHDSAF